MRDVIFSIWHLFRWVCGKEIVVSEILVYKEKTKKLTCDLEKVFPPSFFDLQVHLVSHLVAEVEWRGPVHAQWMYWVERYMKVLKGYVRQHAKAEGSMVAGHLHYEALFYASKSMNSFDWRAPTAWEERDNDLVDTKTLGKKSVYNLKPTKRAQVHDYVLKNHDLMQPHFKEYQDWDKNLRGKRRRLNFLDWMRERVHGIINSKGCVEEDVLSILKGPFCIGGSYNQIQDSGRHFRVYSMDRMSRLSSLAEHKPKQVRHITHQLSHF